MRKYKLAEINSQRAGLVSRYLPSESRKTTRRKEAVHNKEINKKRKRDSWDKHQFKNRAGWTDRHHLIPGSRGGATIPSNLFRLDAYRHDAWHLLFKNKTIPEIKLLLTRVEKIKDAQAFWDYIYYN